MSQEKTDVIVVGGGISGLSAAKLLQDQGLSVLVLEARDRVGGRTFTVRDPAFNYLDLGGTYIGPGQNRILRLAKELGIENQRVNDKQRTVMHMKGKFDAFSGTIPSFPGLIAVLDINNAFRLITEYGKQIPLEAPWSAPRAAEWDSMTVQSWLEATCWTQTARDWVTMTCRAGYAMEPSELSFLFFILGFQTAGGLIPAVSISDGAQERKFVGGSMQISEGLADRIGKEKVLLNHVVSAVEQKEDGVRVTTSNGKIFESSYMISAIPFLLLGKISFQPPLPSLKSQMIQRMPMGSVIKTFTFYETNFWRKLDFSGITAGMDCPVIASMEDVKPDGSHPALMGIIAAKEARKLCSLSEEERKELICHYYAKAFGTDEALHPVNYVELNWMTEEFSGGCYGSGAPPGVLTNFGRVLREPVGRVYFAGTEAAVKWNGYMDGAVEAGERAAKEILFEKGLIEEEEIWEEEPESEDLPLKALDQGTLERLLPSVSGLLKFVATTTGMVAVAALAYLHRDWLKELLGHA